jgi:glycerol-3-phosphate dehydrogenase (NAD(P)+)
MRVGIIGLGNFGTAIGNLIAENGYDVTGWEYNEDAVGLINETHENPQYLADVELDPKLAATRDLNLVATQSDVLFVALPSAFLASTLQSIPGEINPKALLVNLAKGIDQSTGLTAFQTLSRLFPGHRRALLSGPSIANEFARGLPTSVVLAGPDRSDLLATARLLDSKTFRTRFSDDVVGVEYGGILKNMYAIGLGLFDGIGVPSINFRATYLTLGLEEMTQFGVSMGAREETFRYLAGAGDLLATSMSEHSHNRHFGERLGQGYAIQAIEEEMGVLPEGYGTLNMTLYLAEKMHVAMPLARGLWDVIHGKIRPAEYVVTVGL